MNFAQQSALLLSNHSFVQTVPEKCLDILRDGTNTQYLDTLSDLALDPKFTSEIFATHDVVFVEICSRWQKRQRSSLELDPLAIIAALARILPFAPHLSVFVEELLCRQRPGALHVFASRETTALMDLPDESLHRLLLALCRLLMFDNENFASLISPVQLQILLNHTHQCVRYLAIKILCLYLHASDSATVTMGEKYCSNDSILGEWEGKIIDYLFFTLWEEKRMKKLRQELEKARRIYCISEGKITPKARYVLGDLSKTTANLGGVLVPCLQLKPKKASYLFETNNFQRNLRQLATAINTSRALLVTGFAGAGKTSLVRHAARELGKSDYMTTLYLNEQTDAKILIGMYASDSSTGSFTWRPGVLTKAVTEGRWVMIEDLDRAPQEILSTILPLLERRELLVSHWGKAIRAAPGFKIIATIRSYLNARGDEVVPGTNSLGFRHWLRVSLLFPSSKDLAEIIRNRFPILHVYVPEILRVYHSLTSRCGNDVFDTKAASGHGRPLSPRDLFRWCRRLENLLLTAGVQFSNERISEAISDMIFFEAVDCFTSLLPDGSSKTSIVDVIARELYVPANRAHYSLESRRPEYVVGDVGLRIGRINILRRNISQKSKPSSERTIKYPFAITTQVIRVLESVAIAVKMAEPCLLVGETGTGKTAVIQYLAHTLGFKLTVVNLSQNSEAGDLLGGYKPTNIRAIAVPMKEEFDDLFEKTFSCTRNQHYLETIGKAISKGRWLRALTLWQEALRMLDDLYNRPVLAMVDSVLEPHPKRRRLDSMKHQKLKLRWDEFAGEVTKLQVLVTGSSKGIAISFVEGNIVKAARNGGWVLLDEINLAPPDTLESLADLLHHGSDTAQSFMLPEKGDNQRIPIHKDFRIFGAMNPATDIGKRDLPISLRSRFTEIYIDSPDRGFDNLLSVVQAYLGSLGNLDVRAASDISLLYLEIKRLAENNQLVDGANQKPHYSLRTLTRTLVYVTDITPIYGLRRALFEGFSMSFLTLLNKESEMLLIPLIFKYLLGSQKNGHALLRQMPQAPPDNKKYIQFRHYWVAQGASPVQAQPHYIVTPFIERNLLNLVRATSTRRFPVLLQGPTSSGKTSMVEYLARISGNKFIRINNHEHTDLQEYLGSYVSGPDGRLHYQEGVLVNALKEGHWIVLDELNLAPTDVLEALNRLLDDNKELLIPETQQLIKPHKNFMLFATQNPPGMYGGRKVLSRAFRNRFLELHFDDIPEDELETILRERSQIAPSFCSKIVTVYKKLSRLRQRDRLFEQKNSFATLRDLFRWALRDADDRQQLAINGFLLLAERVRNTNERMTVKKIIEDVMKVKIDEIQIYHANSPLMPSILAHSSDQDIIWTKTMRRLSVLVTQALKNDEPVLLVGETGSGKTTICQLIAKAMNTNLHIVNAHQNMETGDLVGSQRPIRNRGLVETQLKEELRIILESHGVFKKTSGESLSTLLTEYDALLQRDANSVPAITRSMIEYTRARARALFEWSDGSLVHAMRNSEHFLLDEISLADDSVLERLNSVLEPDRTLLLAEKGPTNNLVNASPGFQFLSTMNPGGDYGKRELSPALRNRFTEIWVPHVTRHDEILEIVQAKLSASWLSYSSSIVAFAAWYGVTYNHGAPAISIREILAWVQFLNMYTGQNPYEGILHGAAMVYIDGLGANPATKVSIAEAEINSQRRVCLRKLEMLFHHDMASLYDEKHEFLLEEQALKLGPFKLKIFGKQVESSNYSLQAPTTKANVLKIIRALQLPKPILIEGSPGVGKTSLVVVLAKSIGMPLTRINLSEQTDLMDLFGSDVPVTGADAGQFAWHDAPFLRAMQKGEWVLLDEMNLASQAVLEGLNACLDHRGQAYIPELDQTFSRHPNFTVFAAQNPHSQGGGRKGLPASFVNRFTVVYADSFISQDLLMICKHCYPACSDQLVESLTNCVTDIGRLFGTNHKHGIHGAPWEINLRDLLRWLQLVTSRDWLLSAGKTTDYQNLLFLQRFRTKEDTAAVFAVIEKHIPQTKQIHDFFQNIGPSYVQAGLGLITRDILLKPIPPQRLPTQQQNLPLIESIMLCVQKNWPCLLVGSSGCGKSSLLSQLADQTGTVIVDLPLNADMDTTDLVGGYEQVDLQRESAALLRKLRKVTRRNIVDQLVSGLSFNNDLAILQEQLQSSEPDFFQILTLIRNINTVDPTLEFFSIADDCESLVGRFAEEKKAQFEWVDGILVNALKQGHWLVLDNANLCNPSVLDRLNSLLEPNGFLSINEHRSSDGSASVVQPNPAFRLFLTMDPRHGELSRAMRNRCVELYMPATPSTGLEAEMKFMHTYIVSRFQVFGNLEWSTSDDVHFSEFTLVCLDHLPLSSHELIRRWRAQVAIGLINLSSPQHASLDSILSIFTQILRSGSVVHCVRKTYKELCQKLNLDGGFGSMQTINPLNNGPLISLTAHHKFASNLRLLGIYFELLLKIYTFEARLDLLNQNIIVKPASQLSQLERSLVSHQSSHFGRESTKQLAKFLKEMGTFLRYFVNERDFGPQENNQAIASLSHEILSYLTEVFDLCVLPEFDEGAFQAYLMIGRSLVTQGHVHGPETRLITEKLSSMLDLFTKPWQLSTGLSMETIWKGFRPRTAKTMEQLETFISAENLADRFDVLKWVAGVSFQELDISRQSIIRFHDAIALSTSVTGDQFRDIQKALEKLESSSNLSRRPDIPFFVAEFEGLCQYEAMVGLHGNDSNHSVLDLLSDRPTRYLMGKSTLSSPWRILAQIESGTGICSKTNSLMIFRKSFPCSVLAAICNISEAPLRNLASLRTELNFMVENVARLSSAICHDQLHCLNRMLAMLHMNIYEAHRQQLDPSYVERCSNYVNQYCQSSAEDLLLLNVPILRTRQNTPESDYLSRILEGYLNPSLRNLRSTLQQGSNRLTWTASAWILFFTGVLHLYVPDQPFDPAMKLFIDRTRHLKRKAELQAKLQALQEFEMISTGQRSSFRCRIVEEQLQELGQEPSVSTLIRPRISELIQLQGEFNNVLKTIIQRSPSSLSLLSLFQGDFSQIQDIELLRANVEQAIARFSANYRAYDDITKPLIAMLRGLDIGLAIALLATTMIQQDGNFLEHICQSTPFLGMRSSYLSKVTFNGLKPHQEQGLDPRLSFLSTVALSRNTAQCLQYGVVSIMHEVFQSFYRDWKGRLGYDQQKDMAKRSMYRYRGAEEDDDKINEKDFLNMFPDFSENSKDCPEVDIPPYDQKLLARKIAGCQREIFGCSTSATEKILKMLEDASMDIGKLWQRESRTFVSEEPAENLMCGVILGLDRQQSYLNGGYELGKTYSFYADANLAEVKKLVVLLQEIRIQFFELQEVWPEHATISDVLQTLSELMALRHTDPIAKLMTKAEQVHGYIHEWQTVASKDFSVKGLYDRLTSLLVDWRRLELSTWARLLDMEDKKCKDEAESWWFLAYEVIIAIPLSIVHAGQYVHTYLEELFATLTDFLATGSIGQYSPRLRLIECFEMHVASLLKEEPNMKAIQNTLANFLGLYSRFESTIQDSLRQGRLGLEKDMKELILLASWKDTNISVLRESAKRSHHKLFKVVRRYRAHLATSAEQILARGVPNQSESPEMLPHRKNPPRTLIVDPEALEISQQHLPGWDLKPARFTNPILTARKIQHIIQIPFNSLTSAFCINNWATDLVESIKKLQTETPKKATNENKDQIKHLKTRKKNIFAESLKSLRHMGFKSNLSADVRTQQASTAIILTKSPASQFAATEADFWAAEYQFHQVLYIMPQIRQHYYKHSDDLSHGEISRSIGYLESILSVIIKQRAISVESRENLDVLEKNMELMQNLWAPQAYTIHKEQSCEVAVRGISYSVRWLPSILEAGSNIVIKTSHLGGLDSTAVVTRLTNWKNRMIDLIDRYNRLPKLPIDLSCSSQTEIDGQAKSSLIELKADLRKLSEENKNVGFILRQIELWTECEENKLPSNYENKLPSIDITELDLTMWKIVDCILVATQRTQKILSSLPISNEENGWLTKLDKAYSACLWSLHPRGINKLFEGLISKIKFLELPPETSLQVVGALCAVTMPIIQQYRDSFRSFLDHYVKLHKSVCRLATISAQSFNQIASQGFCSPFEDSAPKAENSEMPEKGTGLGEGEGVDDISKDIQDDEDLTELAQELTKNKDESKIEDQEDAVNMDREDLEGEMGDAAEDDVEDQLGDDEGESQIDEETGDVDDLDPSAVNEKLWNQREENADKEKEGSKAAGKATNEQVAADVERKQEFNEDDVEDDDHNVDETEEGEHVGQKEDEKIDPHLQEGQKLDLPEDLNFDGNDRMSAFSLSDEDDIGPASVTEGMDDEEEKADFSGNEVSDQEYSKEYTDVEAVALDSEKDVEAKDDADEIERSGSPVDTEPDNDEMNTDTDLRRDHTIDSVIDIDGHPSNDSQGIGEGNHQQVHEETQSNHAQGKEGSNGNSANLEDPKAASEEGQLDHVAQSSANISTPDNQPRQGRRSQAFKKLGDALEKWHRQQQQVQDAQESREPLDEMAADIDMAYQIYEHLDSEEANADTQALGAATHDQAHALNEQAFESQVEDRDPDFTPDLLDEATSETLEAKEMLLRDSEENGNQQEQSKTGALMIENTALEGNLPKSSSVYLEEQEDDITHLDNNLSTIHLQSNASNHRSSSEALRLWTHYSALTHPLSLTLTEQLRLILAPTLATKMRGDFRTGKRLNIKRIIPYIASSYKRDKIWMRRSVPSKRAYQILLAVDDSKSMSESSAGHLAFETLALVAKSLSMLEVGEICVVGFGAEVHIAHEFDKPFTADAGVDVFRQFTFRQERTDVGKLVERSTDLLRDARGKSTRAGAGDLWQLEIIISDGVCEGHDEIRRLVRRAQEERIVIVFVIVDACKGESILDMSQAVFEPDDSASINNHSAAAEVGSVGGTKLKIKRYLDGFPFAYYIVVGNVQELPGVLATALKQWFAEVVESGNYSG